MFEPSSDHVLPMTLPLLQGHMRTQSRNSSLPKSFPSRNFYVSLPFLSSAKKAEYHRAILPSEVGFDLEDLDKIVGECHIDNCLHYFVRFRDGVAHKFLADAFKASYKDLVEIYKRNKKLGLLAPFDPSASYVHPQSRVNLRLSINKSRSAITVSSTFGSLSKPSASDESELSSVTDSIDGSDYEEDEEEALPLRTTRGTSGRKRTLRPLPFSPKKTRSRKMFTVPDSDDEDPRSMSESEWVATRRSTRIRTSTKVKKIFDDSYSLEDGDNKDSENDEDRGTNRVGPSRKASKRRSRKLIRRAAYGRIRATADLGYDSQSDEETVPLREHRSICEKCHREPAHKLMEMQTKKPKGKKKSQLDFDEGDEEEKLADLGGWLRCLKCPVVAHWRCLATTQRDEILKAAWEREKALVISPTAGNEAPAGQREHEGVVKRMTLGAYETTEFICGACMKGGICMGCLELALEPDASPQSKDAREKTTPSDTHATEMNPLPYTKDGDVEMTDGDSALEHNHPEEIPVHVPSRELLYRCFSCKRLAHYRCLPCPSTLSPPVDSVILADWYQSTTDWSCADCSSFVYALDKIIAWRPYPPNSTEPPRQEGEPPNYKSRLPREYLVKWADRSYRRTQWVPHMWLVSTHPAKLRNFLAKGSTVDLLAEPAIGEAKDTESELTFEVAEDESVDSQIKTEARASVLPSDPIPDAELKIPLAWKTIDRVLDILLWYPRKRRAKAASKRGKENAKRKMTIESDGELSELTGEDEERAAIFNDGEEPASDVTETVDEFQRRTGRDITIDDISQIVWVFIKWDDLGYDEATWDSPPMPNELGYSAFEAAFERFIYSRHVTVPILNKKQIKEMDDRPKDGFRRSHSLKDDEQPELGQNSELKLMPFQVAGFNWLSNNWWNRQHCILADDMGLGKTVQLATFIGNVVKNWEVYPILIVVPNSTITNWIREMQRWAPHLRVVPYHGEAKAREVLKKFELKHVRSEPGTTGAKFHVLVTTYDCLNNPKDFSTVFKAQPRWEVLVVDEGQRLKNDSSVLFRKLNLLNSVHRIIMTGTPLNNNIRELFNLMNFLDPGEWHDLEKLEKEYEELTDELVKQLHSRLRPYFLRRTKSEVLQLPPKNEVIVPVSMTPLQKEVYRLILSQNVEILKSLAQQSKFKSSTSKNKTNISNVLMQLRKCLQHPYLFASHIEPAGLSAQETHEKLIDASAKLRLLKVMLPKLKARGHRVLLFSQFVIALDVIEDFLDGENIKHLRLDGKTKQSSRQKDMDEFNRPGTDVFIYLLSTRAGGVGINLWSADTVIIFDPDFNPHQDLQAIARAHRYGQTKKCLVFKLMVKDSAEERIVQTGKKKMVLDHLIVQKMDEDSAGETMQSILTYGAQALFDEDQGDRDIIYTDNDIEKLIEKTEKEGDQEEVTKEQGPAFSFAKIWAADKDSLEEITEDIPDDQGDSWAQALKRIVAVQEQRQIQEVMGRGVRRRAAFVIQPQELDFDDSPQRPTKSGRKKSKSVASDDTPYSGSGTDSDGSVPDVGEETWDNTLQELVGNRDGPQHRSFLIGGPKSSTERFPNARPKFPPLSPIHNHSYHDDSDEDREHCGLCGMNHDGPCPMTERSENLSEYRRMLLTHADDESTEERLAAIKAIDEALEIRGHLDLIAGQPLHIAKKGSSIPHKATPQLVPVVANSTTKKDDKAITSDHTKILQWRSTKPQGLGDTHKMEQRKLARKTKSQFHAATPTLMKPSAVESTSVSGDPFAMSSKRSSPFPEDSSRNKKPKQSVSVCVVCGMSPHHARDCPVAEDGHTTSTGDQATR